VCFRRSTGLSRVQAWICNVSFVFIVKLCVFARDLPPLNSHVLFCCGCTCSVGVKFFVVLFRRCLTVLWLKSLYHPLPFPYIRVLFDCCGQFAVPTFVLHISHIRVFEFLVLISSFISHIHIFFLFLYVMCL